MELYKSTDEAQHAINDLSAFLDHLAYERRYANDDEEVYRIDNDMAEVNAELMEIELWLRTQPV